MELLINTLRSPKKTKALNIQQNKLFKALTKETEKYFLISFLISFNFRAFNSRIFFLGYDFDWKFIF